MQGIDAVLGYELIPWRGQDWKLPRPDVNTRGHIQKYLEARDYEKLKTHAKTFLRQDYLDLLDKKTASWTAGLWAWGSPMFWQAVQTPEFFCELIRTCLLQVTGQEPSHADVKQMLEDKQAEADALNEGKEPDDPAVKLSDVVVAFNKLLKPTPTTPPPSSGAAAKP